MALKKRLYQVNKMGVVLMTGCTAAKLPGSCPGSDGQQNAPGGSQGVFITNGPAKPLFC